VEYNRFANRVKRLHLTLACVRRPNRNADPAASADVIVHRRDADGPNVLVLDLNKPSNPVPRDCDRLRVIAFREQLESFGII